MQNILRFVLPLIRTVRVINSGHDYNTNHVLTLEKLLASRIQKELPHNRESGVILHKYLTGIQIRTS